ncbi:MAG: hypothetical protein R3C16_03590 [Hyphomonadaceae bacterium]
MNELAKDATTWDSLVYTTYFGSARNGRADRRSHRPRRQGSANACFLVLSAALAFALAACMAPPAVEQENR